MPMKLWLISQTINNDYDTYDSAVVRAETAEQAQKIHPDEKNEGSPPDYKWWEGDTSWNSWAYTLNDVKVVELGLSLDSTPGVVCASFNAG